MSREAMQQALEALMALMADNAHLTLEGHLALAKQARAAIGALEAALAEQVEPVATADASLGAAIEAIDAALAKQAQPLTDEDIDALVAQHAGYGRGDFRAVARAVEAAVLERMGVQR